MGQEVGFQFAYVRVCIRAEFCRVVISVGPEHKRHTRKVSARASPKLRSERDGVQELESSGKFVQC